MADGDPQVLTAPAADTGNEVHGFELPDGSFAAAVVLVDPTTGDPVEVS